jgi:hypothetical protein
MFIAFCMICFNAYVFRVSSAQIIMLRTSSSSTLIHRISVGLLSIYNGFHRRKITRESATESFAVWTMYRWNVLGRLITTAAQSVQTSTKLSLSHLFQWEVELVQATPNVCGNKHNLFDRVTSTLTRSISKLLLSRIGGVVVSKLATGHQGSWVQTRLRR